MWSYHFGDDTSSDFRDDTSNGPFRANRTTAQAAGPLRSHNRGSGGQYPPEGLRTCRYRGGKFGVRSAMPSVIARRKCPDLIFAQPRFDVYKEVSLQIRAIFAEHTAIIEPLSLDEAYLDVTQNLQRTAPGPSRAEQIRPQIRAGPD